ncbi:hypothetical protein JMM81_22105 [Bacillus sp. V3B]|uniref:hypothetical protein n=1 Tax=Bacillus sp. V3B TaxID=2804915 RepID=UPI00210CACCE|nr:hypothetical protein [Bacillus sp. V3B]MCQ6277553.1 hypothetical protein [Bacillus sp. V3B]
MFNPYMYPQRNVYFNNPYVYRTYSTRDKKLRETKDDKRNNISTPKKIKVVVHAFNLRTPTHMEWTQDGRLLVSEHTAGEVKDITNGGDFKNVRPFAYGLQGPSSILPLPNGRILVAEAWGNRVTDITHGGNALEKPPYLTLSEPYSLSTLNGNIYATEQNELSNLELSEITGGEGVVSESQPIVTGIPVTPLPGLEGLSPYIDMQDVIGSTKCGSWTIAIPTDIDFGYPSNGFSRSGGLYLSCSVLGQIIKVPKEGGNYFDLIDKGHLFAWGLDFSGGMIMNRNDGLIYVTQPLKGTVMAVDPNDKRDYRFDPPVVKGLSMPTCVRFSPDGKSMFICSMTTGTIWKVTNF